MVGVIYDFDELMVNSTALHIKAWEEILKPYHMTNAQAINAGHIGMRTIDIIKDLSPQLGWNAHTQHEEYMRILVELARKSIEPMPGLRESIIALQNAKIPLAIGSSGTRAYIAASLEHLKLKDAFDAIVTGDDVAHGKPSPDIYLLAAKKLNLAPSQCVVLEDATNGIAAAKAAGCACIAIRNPHTPPQDLGKADKIVRSLHEVTPQLVRELAQRNA